MCLAKNNEPLEFKVSKYPSNTVSLLIHHTWLTLGCIYYISEATLRQKIITCVKSTDNVWLHIEALSWPEDMKRDKSLLCYVWDTLPQHNTML